MPKWAENVIVIVATLALMWLCIWIGKKCVNWYEKARPIDRLVAKILGIFLFGVAFITSVPNPDPIGVIIVVPLLLIFMAMGIVTAVKNYELEKH